MEILTENYQTKNKKTSKKSVKDFSIDTSHYKSKGPKIIKTINITL